MALCASLAVNVLPSYLELFLKDMTFYFIRSSKRRRETLWPFSKQLELCKIKCEIGTDKIAYKRESDKYCY